MNRSQSATIPIELGDVCKESRLESINSVRDSQHSARSPACALGPCGFFLARPQPVGVLLEPAPVAPGLAGSTQVGPGDAVTSSGPDTGRIWLPMHEDHSDETTQAATAKATDRFQRGREPLIREDGSIEIPLTQGQVAIVDPCRYCLVKDSLWYAHWDRCTSSFYAVRAGHSVAMHRVLAGAMRRAQVDHVNHDTLDCRGCNLRLASSSENMMNRRKQSNNSSGYKGVHWHIRLSCWVARIKINGKRAHLGRFDSAEDAALAYDTEAARIFGEFALTNQMLGLLREPVAR